MTEQILLLIIGSVMGGAAIWYVLNKKSSGPDPMIDHKSDIQRMMNEHMDRVMAHMDRSKDFLANRVSAAERSVRSVSAGLGKLEEATTSLRRTSDELVSFQQLLKNPKVRGSFGEVLLTNLLGEVLPQDRFELQSTMPTSGYIADAIIRLQDGHIVAIDAKFPLANYEMYAREEDEERKHRLRKDFVRDVKKHIKDISSKYISPQEKTLDYAFMYIPIEGVYYETMVHDQAGESLWDFCLVHHVIPVSPNSFLAYLQTVLVGLRGMKIESQAREILQHLGQLRQDFSRFAEDFSTVGTHLSNAKNRYDDSARRLDRFANRLEQVEGPSNTSFSEANTQAELTQKIPQR